MFVKEAFLSYAEVLFDDLPKKCAIISRIKDMPVSPWTVEGRITDMATDVTRQPTVALKAANVFSIGLDKSIDMNDNPRLAVVARYCSNGEAHKELYRMKPMCGTTEGKVILDIFTKNFEERGIDIKKIFSVATVDTPAIMGQRHGFVTLVEQRLGTLL